jgi:xanthosine utilization system XapX-like protein
MPSPLRSLLLFFASLLLAAPAQAHEGHDHGAPPPPVSTTIAPRADASSTMFELVAVARGARLVVYLDGFRDNAPVKGAQVEIDAEGSTRSAREEADGVYALDAPWAARPGAHDLAFTVTAGAEVDVLTATLTIPAPPPPAVAPPGLRGIVSQQVRAALAQVTPQNGAALLVGLGGFVAGLFAAGLWRRRAAPRLRWRCSSPPASSPTAWRRPKARQRRSPATSRNAFLMVRSSCRRRRSAFSPSAPR